MSFLGNGPIITAYQQAVTNITGTEFYALLGLVMVFMAFGIAARLDFEIILVATMGMLLTFLAYNGEMLLLSTLALLILAYYSAKIFFS